MQKFHADPSETALFSFTTQLAELLAGKPLPVRDTKLSVSNAGRRSVNGEVAAQGVNEQRAKGSAVSCR